MPKVVFHEEVMFAGYRDSNASGPVMSFLLSDAEHLALFRGMTAAKGGKAGQRFYLTLVPIADDERTDGEPNDAAHRKLGPLALLAVQWCRDPGFQEWAGVNWPTELPPRRLTHEECRAVILDVCKIGSRKELDTVPSAAAVFQREFRGPFMTHIERNS